MYHFIFVGKARIPNISHLTPFVVLLQHIGVGWVGGWLGGWVGGWLGGVDELTIKLTSASTRVGVEVGLSLAMLIFKMTNL